MDVGFVKLILSSKLYFECEFIKLSSEGIKRNQLVG